jgi:dihydrofolate reductase
MRELKIAEFITLDGVIQAPGGDVEDTDGGFTQGGWTVPYWHDDIGKHFEQVFSQADTLLLGRKTWQIHGSSFEIMDGDPFADMMNAIHKYVVSSTLKTASAWRNSSLITRDVIETIRNIKQQPGKNILMDGSSVLAPALAEHDLVDEYCLHVYPLVLGSGKRLFQAGKPHNFTLVEVSPLPTGVVYIRYRRVA